MIHILLQKLAKEKQEKINELQKLMSWFLSAALTITTITNQGLIELPASNLATPSVPDELYIHKATNSLLLPDIELSGKHGYIWTTILYTCSL